MGAGVEGIDGQQQAGQAREVTRRNPFDRRAEQPRVSSNAKTSGVMARATIQLSATRVSPIISPAYISSSSRGTLKGEILMRTSARRGGVADSVGFWWWVLWRRGANFSWS